MYNWLSLLSRLVLSVVQLNRFFGLITGCTLLLIVLFAPTASAKIVEVRFAGTVDQVIASGTYAGNPEVGPVPLGPFYGQFSYDDAVTPFYVEVLTYSKYAAYKDFGGSITITFSDGTQFSNANDGSYRIFLQHSAGVTEYLNLEFSAAEQGKLGGYSVEFIMRFFADLGSFEFSPTSTIPPVSSYYPSSESYANGGQLAEFFTEPCVEGANFCVVAVTHTITTVYEPNYVNCQGFDAPFESALNISRKANRAIPVPLELFDTDGFELRDTDITAPPVIDVDFIGMVTNDGNSVLNDELLQPIGNSNETNAFAFNTETDRWEYRLGTKQFAEPGTYRVTARSGNDEKYVIKASGQCAQTFTRQP